MTSPSKPTTAFWVISILALLWNLAGIASFAAEILMSPETLAAMPDDQRALYESTPAWQTFVYGIAVFAGTAGCIMLLMKKKSAYRVFLVSLIAVLIQMVYSFFFTNATEVMGMVAVVMPLIVIGIAIFLLWYSKYATDKGWLQ